MKAPAIVAGISLILFIEPGCKTTEGEIAAIKRYGVTAYNPPQGDPRTSRDVNIYGPGAVIRTRTSGYEAGASALVGKDTVAGWAQASDSNSAPYALPNIDTSSGYGIVAEGGNVPSASFAYKLKAKLDSKRKTTLKATFGQTRVLNPLGEADLRSLLRKHRSDFDSETVRNIKSGKSAVVLQAYFCKSISYTYTQDGKTNVDLNAALTGQDIAKISANGLKVINNTLVYDQPVFIGYTPLSDAGTILAAQQ